MRRNRLLAVVVFIVPWVMWILAIGSASHSGFFEDQWGVQTMVLGGAVSCLAGAIANFWEW